MQQEGKIRGYTVTGSGRSIAKLVECAPAPLYE